MTDTERTEKIEFLLDWDVKLARGKSKDELVEVVRGLLQELYIDESDEYIEFVFNMRMGNFSEGV